MMGPGAIAALLAGGVAVAGIAQAAIGLAAVRQFARRAAPLPRHRPRVTVLKPLHGDEPMLEEALESLFRQDYPTFQIVFGVSSPTDAAIAVVRRLRHRYLDQDMQLVIDGAQHGANRKISNLINMLPAATHELLVVADSDVHAAPDYLDRIVAEFTAPDDGVAAGVVTTLYAGRKAHRGAVGALGSSYISHIFLPGALLARALGRQDCLGATMAMRRQTLEEIGGFEALVPYVADDAVLGQLALRHGLDVRLATTVPTTTVPELQLRALFQHELRWARTIRSLAPLGHALSLVQFPIAWSLLSVLASPRAAWSWALFAAAWMMRAAAARAVDRLMQLPDRAPIWLMPARDVLCALTILASYAVKSVRWRGHTVTLRALVGEIEPVMRYGTASPRLAPADDTI